LGNVNQQCSGIVGRERLIATFRHCPDFTARREWPLWCPDVDRHAMKLSLSSWARSISDPTRASSPSGGQA
jgi:hypothetical protein